MIDIDTGDGEIDVLRVLSRSKRTCQAISDITGLVQWVRQRGQKERQEDVQRPGATMMLLHEDD